MSNVVEKQQNGDRSGTLSRLLSQLKKSRLIVYGPRKDANPTVNDKLRNYTVTVCPKFGSAVLNSIRRDRMLLAVSDLCPSLFDFVDNLPMHPPPPCFGMLSSLILQKGYSHDALVLLRYTPIFANENAQQTVSSRFCLSYSNSLITQLRSELLLFLCYLSKRVEENSTSLPPAVLGHSGVGDGGRPGGRGGSRVSFPSPLNPSDVLLL